MKPVTVLLTLAKSTDGTRVYMENAALSRAERTFPTIYIQKHALPDPPPPTIQVTLQIPD